MAEMLWAVFRYLAVYCQLGRAETRLRHEELAAARRWAHSNPGPASY